MIVLTVFTAGGSKVFKNPQDVRTEGGCLWIHAADNRHYIYSPTGWNSASTEDEEEETDG